jgi:hypothetical protein
MKKIIIAALLVTFSATSSFAIAPVATSATGSIASPSVTAGADIIPTGTPSGVLGASVGKLSTGVSMAWNILPTSYCLITAHSSGLKKFGTGSDSTAIMWKALTTKGEAVAQPTTATAAGSVIGATWTVM